MHVGNLLVIRCTGSVSLLRCLHALDADSGTGSGNEKKYKDYFYPCVVYSILLPISLSQLFKCVIISKTSRAINVWFNLVIYNMTEKKL